MVIQRKVKKKIPKTSVADREVAVTPEPVLQQEGPVSDSAPGASIHFVLGTDMVISNIREWREKMLASLSGAKEIVLDGGEVEHIDCTGLQLLVALMREAAANKTNVSWRSASEVLKDNASQLGLTVVLSLDKLPEAG